MKAHSQGIVGVAGQARTLQLAITHSVVWIPTLGTGLALFLALKHGVQVWELALLLGMYVATLTGVELGFHRYVSHQSFGTTGPIRALLVILGSMAAQGPVLYWASTHRRHHAHSDKVGDPHSPLPRGKGARGRVTGFLHGHMGWLFEPVQTDWLRYVQDLLGDRLLFALNGSYFLWVVAGLAVPAGIGLAVTGRASGALQGLLWGGLVRIFLVHHVVWGVNSLCHRLGARPFRAQDDSRNNILLVLPSLGGAWHNNHHAFPFTADNRMAWWQFDFCGALVRFLGILGLARDIRYPSADERQRRRGGSSPQMNLSQRTP